MSEDYFNDIEQCVNVLKKQGLIIYPTDTIWGVGCDATSTVAVQKVYEIKKRDLAKTFIVLLEDEAKISYYVENVPPIAFDLMKQVNTPLTIIYPKARNLAPHCIAPDGHVAIRIVRDPFCKELISKFGKPIVSTSANIAGESAPKVFNDINKNLLSAVDYIVNYRRSMVSNIRPSTIIRLKDEWNYEVIRS
ncbi:MAG: threonylcarbamoyl-AMP synthase [Bacteroidales bacterium]|jgi:L-threonylcarbamoyladenylate synthase|nr:threonylcarbamoyl-AMP synthase [Bacteroidales bacterium]